MDIRSLGICGICAVPLVVLIAVLFHRVRRQAKLLSELFETTPMAAAVVSTDSRVLRVNRDFTQLFGYTSQEAAGSRIGELILPEEQRDEDRHVLDELMGRRRSEVESRLQRKDGTHLYAAITAVPVAFPGGRIEIYMAYRDISGHKRAEHALRQSEQDLRELLKERVSLSRDLHDHIVQAIYAVGLGLERLQRSAPPDIATSLAQSVATLNQVILDARKYIAGSQPLRVSESEFRAELTETIDAAVGAEGPRFEIDIDPYAFAALDGNLIEHVTNIAREALSNALRHSGAGRVVLTLRSASGGVRMEIADDGAGFTRSDRQIQRSGLQNMASRAREVDATLDIISTSQGTRVIVEVPAKAIARAGEEP